MRRKRYFDPYWETTRAPVSCGQCRQPIPTGGRVFLFASGAHYCDADDCGRQAERDFVAAVQDEATYNGSY